jgi:hypothetical protein
VTELAHHFGCSGNVPKAVGYLSRSGHKAAEQGAQRTMPGLFCCFTCCRLFQCEPGPRETFAIASANC